MLPSWLRDLRWVIPLIPELRRLWELLDRDPDELRVQLQGLRLRLERARADMDLDEKHRGDS